MVVIKATMTTSVCAWSTLSPSNGNSRRVPPIRVTLGCICHFILLLTLFNQVRGFRHHHSNLEINDVGLLELSEYQGAYPADSHLPECGRQGICSYLQANTKGISARSVCRCRSPLRCPTKWDPTDGHSITQGSEQYKFCESAPKLKPCSEDVLAYSSRIASSKVTERKVLVSQHLYCVCPETWTYKEIESFEDEDEETIVETFKSSCVPLKTCELEQPCKSVTDTANTFWANPICRCPEGLSCPTLTRHGVKTIFMNDNAIHLIHCQKRQ